MASAPHLPPVRKAARELPEQITYPTGFGYILGPDGPVEMTREQVEAWGRPMLEASFRQTEDALATAGTDRLDARVLDLAHEFAAERHPHALSIISCAQRLEITEDEAEAAIGRLERRRELLMFATGVWILPR
jgi:hypothetical protein